MLTECLQLYKLGPGETLENYKIHLQNFIHREKLNKPLCG